MGCLDKSLVEGKIVLCRVLEGITEAFMVGAMGSVAALESEATENPSPDDFSSVVPVAGSGLKEDDFNLVVHYFNYNK